MSAFPDLSEAVRQLAAEKAAALDAEYGCCHSERDFLVGVVIPLWWVDWETDPCTDMLAACRFGFRTYVRDCASRGVAP